MNLVCKRPWTQNLEFKNQQCEQKSYHHPFVHDHSPGKRSHSCKQHSFVPPKDSAFDPLSTYNSYLCTQSTLIRSSICQNVITRMATIFPFFSRRSGTSIICKVVSSLPQFGGSVTALSWGRKFQNPQFQSEAKCKPFFRKISFICMKTYNYHNKGFTLASFWRRGLRQLLLELQIPTLLVPKVVKNSDRSKSLFAAAMVVHSLCADEIKLWLTPSAKQCRNPCSGLPAVYPDLGTRHDWPVKKAFVLFVVIANQVEGKFETHFR